VVSNILEQHTTSIFRTEVRRTGKWNGKTGSRGSGQRRQDDCPFRDHGWKTEDRTLSGSTEMGTRKYLLYRAPTKKGLYKAHSQCRRRQNQEEVSALSLEKRTFFCSFRM
jgi:hypothetical protein